MYKGIEGEEWEELYCHHRDERARQQEPKSQESKSESPLGDEGGQGKGEIHYDPARKEDILGRTETRLGLWEEHLKDPVNALESIKVLGEPLLRLAIGSKLLVESRVDCNGLQLRWVPRSCKRCVKDTLLRRRLALPGPVGQCAPAHSVHLLERPPWKYWPPGELFSLSRSRWWLQTTCRPTPLSLRKRSRRVR